MIGNVLLERNFSFLRLTEIKIDNNEMIKYLNYVTTFSSDSTNSDRLKLNSARYKVMETVSPVGDFQRGGDRGRFLPTPE